MLLTENMPINYRPLLVNRLPRQNSTWTLNPKRIFSLHNRLDTLSEDRSLLPAHDSRLTTLQDGHQNQSEALRSDYLSASRPVSILPQVPYDILQVIVQGALNGDAECRTHVSKLHNEISTGETGEGGRWNAHERLLIRKAYAVIDLELIASLAFTTTEVVDTVRAQFFPASLGEEMQNDDFNVFIHGAMRAHKLPRQTASQILLLATASPFSSESEAERAVFEYKDPQPLGPNGCVTAGPHSTCLYEGVIALEDEDIAAAKRHDSVQRRVQETEAWIRQDRRSYGSQQALLPREASQCDGSKGTNGRSPTPQPSSSPKLDTHITSTPTSSITSYTTSGPQSSSSTPFISKSTPHCKPRRTPALLRRLRRP